VCHYTASNRKDDISLKLEHKPNLIYLWQKQSDHMSIFKTCSTRRGWCGQ